MTRNMNIWLLLNCEIRRTYALIHASKNKTAGIFPSKYSNNHLHYKNDHDSTLSWKYHKFQTLKGYIVILSNYDKIIMIIRKVDMIKNFK